MTHDETNPQFKVISATGDDGTTACNGGHCPTVYEDGDDLIIQGFVAEYLFTAGYLPEGENVVRVPKSLIRPLVKAL